MPSLVAEARSILVPSPPDGPGQTVLGVPSWVGDVDAAQLAEQFGDGDGDQAEMPVAVKPDDTRHAALLACRSSIVSMVAGCGSLIHAFWGSAGGTGLRRNRSGWAA